MTAIVDHISADGPVHTFAVQHHSEHGVTRTAWECAHGTTAACHATHHHKGTP